LELEQLRYEGFVVMHDIELERAGNIDHLVNGPSGIFLVETKFRSYKLPSLGLMRKHAAQLREELGVWITPVLCKATIDYEPRQHRGVWILGKPQLLGWIRAQHNRPADFERLARWADRL
ncbi:MAG: nuclease-related domain-containing protein, partial [Gaiellaceae bacterium]